MSKPQPLSMRVYEDKVLWDVIKAVGYGGFPFRELYQRLKPLVEEHGTKKVSAALFEVAEHAGWVTKLNPAGRKAAWGVCGFSPESWGWVYRDVFGNPQLRPPEHQVPPEIPPRQTDPILDALCRLTATELDMKLRQSRVLLRTDAAEHEKHLAAETIPRVESELLRRGEDVPPEEPKKRRTRKKT
jgi:hypothetical protein